jgi:chromosome segregation ATPase
MPEDGGEAISALRESVIALADRERLARDKLIEARDELLRREQAFALLEAELWSRFDEHERRATERIAELERELSGLRATVSEREQEALRLRVRLERIEESLPLRVYARAKGLPGLRALAAWRTRGYEAALRRRLGT